MKKSLSHTRVSVKLRKAEFRKEWYLYIESCIYADKVRAILTSSSCHPKALVKEFSYFLMPCHQHGLGVNLLVQR